MKGKLLLGVALSMALGVGMLVADVRRIREKAAAEVVDAVTVGPQRIYFAVIEGHDYLVSSLGGIVHSETCGCKLNREKD